MNRKYVEILQSHGFQAYERNSNGQPCYEIEGWGLSFHCPAERFPEMLIEYCIRFDAISEFQKIAENRNESFDKLSKRQDDFEKSEELLLSLAFKLIRAEREILRQNVTIQNDVIWFLLTEDIVLFWQEEGNWCIGIYTDFGKKYIVKCPDAERIAETVREAADTFSLEEYYREQLEEIRAGNRLELPAAELIYEGEFIAGSLRELRFELEEI